MLRVARFLVALALAAPMSPPALAEPESDGLPGFPEMLLFADGFESGDLLAWSDTQPPLVHDPDLDGPFTWTSFTTSITVAATGNTFSVKVWVPASGPPRAPFPLAVIAHGFMLPPTQYENYARRLASFGWVAVTPDFPTSLFSPNHRANALDLLGVVDWAAGAPQLAGLVDTARTAMLGHSLGGKVALLAAVLDSRVRAVVGLDPVDTVPLGCSPTDCPDVSSLMPGLTIPTLLLGEILDATGLQPCAPAADNYTTFYAGTPSPSLEVTAVGAAHMSFLDDISTCGLPCQVCQAGTTPNATVNALARAYSTAFLERRVRGVEGYETYLTGDEAQARYVLPGLVTLRWR
jgi:pimeloyl-ACP methyl ester carboxylesterase